MKRLLAMSMAVMMMLGVTSVVSAAEDGDTKTTGTTDTESNQSGEVWATLSGEPLKQMKVTVPILSLIHIYREDGTTIPETVQKYRVKETKEWKENTVGDSWIGRGSRCV